MLLVPVGAGGGGEEMRHSMASRLRSKTQTMAVISSGTPPCPVNILVAADRTLNSFQEHFLWPMLVAEFLVAVAANSLALYRFSTQEQRPWNSAVVFSVQLAVSDLLYAMTLPPLAAYLYPPKHWRYGEAMCHLERFLFVCNMLGSVIFITCISLNRYLGVVHPFFTRSYLQPKHAWAISVAGWVLAGVMAAPTLSFSRLTTPQQEGNCTINRTEACIKCLGTASDNQLEAYRAYSLAQAILGCGLPLLLTLVAYGALGRAVLRSHGMTLAEKMHIAVLVASGVALYVGSYVPYYVTQVLNLSARQRWRAHCPAFVDVAEAVDALDLRSYVGHQVMRGLMPLAICIHPLLYMAVTPSLGCCHQHCLGCREGQTPENTESSGPALPLNVTAASTSGPWSPELSP